MNANCEKEEKKDERIVYCTIVGDSCVGKTSVVKKFLRDDSTSDLSSTVFDNYAGNVHTTEGDYMISIFDTTGQHDYDGLRHYPYAQIDVVIVCYSVIDRTSLINISQFWLPEIKKFTKKDTPIILIATKSDLNNAKCTAIRLDEGISLANKIGAYSLVETSMCEFRNVSKLFEVVAMAAGKKRKYIISKLFLK